MGRTWCLFLFLLSLSVAACERGGQTAAGLSVRIDAPADGAQVPTGQEVVITSTASSNVGRVQRIELHINGELVSEDIAPVASGQEQFTVKQTWVPTEAGAAAVEVVAFDTTGRRSRPATMTLSVAGTPAATTAPFPTGGTTTVRPTATTTAFPSPAPLPSATTAAPTVQLAGTINTDANVRNGPGLTFDRIDGLFTGAAVTAVGRNEPAEWIEIRYGEGKTGWILWSLAGWQGDIRQLPVTR